jgi:non-ribosomal peptide synthetase component F
VQSHGALRRGARSVASTMALGPQDRLLCGVPWTFDYGYVNLQLTLSTGATHVLPDKPASPFAVPPALDRHKPTVLAGIGSLFAMVVGALPSLDTTALRAVTNTGGTIPAPVLDALFGALPQAEVFLNYGLTESYRTACLDPALARARPTSIGRGIPGVEVVATTCSSATGATRPRPRPGCGPTRGTPPRPASRRGCSTPATREPSTPTAC